MSAVDVCCPAQITAQLEKAGRSGLFLGANQEGRSVDLRPRVVALSVDRMPIMNWNKVGL